MSTVMSARPVGRSHRSPQPVTAPARPVLVRECDRDPGLFDLPDAAEIESHANPLAGSMPMATLESVAEENAVTTKFARRAKAAVAACGRCPFLQTCQREATERILSGQRPQSEVRAAVAFDSEGLPAPAVHDRPARQDIEQLTLDMELGLSGDVADEDIDWLPAGLEPIATYDALAVDMALDEVRVNATITQTHLDRKPDTDTSGRVVLSYSDELEVLRRGLATGQATNRLAQIIGVKWQRVAEVAHILGRTPGGQFVPSDWAAMRRSMSDLDSARTSAVREAAVREQTARDRIAVRRDHDFERVLDIADRRNLYLVSRPAPLSSRLVRTAAVLEHSSAVHEFTALSRVA
ncbi:hypothetical protein ACFQNE_03010 [Gordonia phosphorivorans]|uniref:4Fe-4S Wbl-type domain-containing protein n=1 Tax=Gordonia phosphorivorans TaxID=1056982 RepID=A0ABV6H6I7_9ACTN